MLACRVPRALTNRQFLMLARLVRLAHFPRREASGVTDAFDLWLLHNRAPPSATSTVMKFVFGLLDSDV